MENKITAIVEHNGTMKTTVLGILSQTFTIEKNNPKFGAENIQKLFHKFCYYLKI